MCYVMVMGCCASCLSLKSWLLVVSSIELIIPKGTVFVVANPSNLVHRIKLCNMLQHHFEVLSRIYSLPVEFCPGSWVTGS